MQGLDRGLDSRPVTVSWAMRIAKEYYTEETYQHAVRVATYVAENDIIPQEYREECVALAFCHDLLEDTKFSPAGLPECFGKALKLLTKSKDVNYDDYCKELKDTQHTNWRMCAYWVKLADMKDHLNQVDTLTPALKEKYLSGLRYLL